MSLTLRPALPDDAPLLARMNRQLADDERSRNNMNVAALTVRMEKWLSENWRGIVFEDDAEPAGYCVYEIGSDYYDPSIAEVYIKQFFVAREKRGWRIGSRAFELLVTTVFPSGAPIHLDVLETNPPGRRFWEAVGFRPYSTAMRFEPGNPSRNS